MKYSEQILSNLKEYGAVIPTPIQRQAIPCLSELRHTIGIAQTGVVLEINHMFYIYTRIVYSVNS